MVSVLRGGIGLCIVEVGSLLGVYGMGSGGSVGVQLQLS